MPLRTSHKRRRSRFPWIILAVSVLLLAAAAVLFVNSNVFLNGSLHSVHETSLTIPDADASALRGIARMKELKSLVIEEPVNDPGTVEKLYDLLPACSVSFHAVLSGGSVDSECESVSVSDSSDFRWLPCLKKLKTVNLAPVRLPADDAFVQAALSYIRSAPVTELFFADGSPEGFRLYPGEADPDCSAMDPGQVDFILPFLADGSTVILPDSISQDGIDSLLERYPVVSFVFRDQPAAEETALIEELTDTETLLDQLSSFRNLKTVDLSAFNANWEQIAAVSELYPDSEILFRTELYGREVTSDTEYLILDGIRVEDLSPLERILPAARNLLQIDMCGCGVPDEEMAAFRDRNPGRKIVWTVDLKHWTVRTDITHFATWNRIKTDENGLIVTARNVGGNTSRSLAPLQYCTDLVALDLGHNKITDLSFLSGLKNLKYLIIALNEVTDLTPLSGLSELKYLEIFSNENITDISPLSNLKKLEALCMSDTKVTDLSPLYGNQALRRLYLQGYRFDKKARAEIAKELPDCTVLYKALGSTGSDWRQCDYYTEMRKALGWKIDG